MKFLFKVLLTGLIMNAAVQAGRTAWNHYEFKDAVEQEARFGRSKTSSELHGRVLEIASERGVPLEYEDVVVEANQGQTRVEVNYTEAVELIPRMYTHQQPLTMNVNIRVTRPLTVDDLR